MVPRGASGVVTEAADEVTKGPVSRVVDEEGDAHTVVGLVLPIRGAPGVRRERDRLLRSPEGPYLARTGSKSTPSGPITNSLLLSEPEPVHQLSGQGRDGDRVKNDPEGCQERLGTDTQTV